MTKSCEMCGRSMEAARSTKRYCSSSCRANASKGFASAPVTPLPDRAPAPEVDEVTTVRSAVLVELDAAGVAKSPMGASALAIAARLDSGVDPGSGMAALNRELRSTLAEALRGKTKSPVQSMRDELAERRRA